MMNANYVITLEAPHCLLFNINKTYTGTSSSPYPLVGLQWSDGKCHLHQILSSKPNTMLKGRANKALQDSFDELYRGTAGFILRRIW